MKRQWLIALPVLAVLVSLPLSSTYAGNPHGRGGCNGGGFGHGFGGIAIGGIGGGGGCGWDIAELYHQLYNNLPYFALHPPVYYSEPVPRTYGYSPFAYPPGVMTPELVCETQPITINNPYVPAIKSATPAAPAASNDRAAAVQHQVEPLVIINPYVTAPRAVAQNER